VHVQAVVGDHRAGGGAAAGAGGPFSVAAAGAVEVRPSGIQCDTLEAIGLHARAMRQTRQRPLPSVGRHVVHRHKGVVRAQCGQVGRVGSDWIIRWQLSDCEIGGDRVFVRGDAAHPCVRDLQRLVGGHRVVERTTAHQRVFCKHNRPRYRFRWGIEKRVTRREAAAWITAPSGPEHLALHCQNQQILWIQR
jgi:hypothetical protein